MPEATAVVPTSFKNENELKQILATQYMKQIGNFFGDEDRALRFLSGVMAATQRNPRLLECTPTSVVNSFMTMAQLQLMPSDVSGEAYVIPYSNNKNVGGVWVKVLEAQFQLGYQGLITLFYRAGVKEIVADVVREKDAFEYENGMVSHKPDVFADDRGKVRGAYVIITLGTGGKVCKVMSEKEILHIAKTFSKSYGAKSTPWGEASDPMFWMYKKTVLKQAGKLVPKNDAIAIAIAKDNEGDSNLLEEKPSFKVEELEAKLRACKSLPVLATTFALLPAEAKLVLVAVKDEMKAALTPKVAETADDIADGLPPDMGGQKPPSPEELAEMEATPVKK